MIISTPATVADVPQWLALWAQSLEENGQLAGAVLRQVAAGLAGQLAADDTPTATIHERCPNRDPGAGQCVKAAGHAPPCVTAADYPAADTLRCPQSKLFARRVRNTDAPSWHPNDGADVCDCQQCWRSESDIVQCHLDAGHDGMHAGEYAGAACYWQIDPTPSALVDFAAADAAAIPAGPSCDSHGPHGARCIAVCGHDGPCWAPDARHGRVGWDRPVQPESGQFEPVPAANGTVTGWDVT